MARPKREFHFPTAMVLGPRMRNAPASLRFFPLKAKGFAVSASRIMILLKGLLILFLFTTFILPLYVMESGLMNSDESNHSLRGLVANYGKSFHLLTRSTSNSQPSITTKAPETPALDDFKAAAVRGEDSEHNYDAIYDSNGLHESYSDRRINEFSSFQAYTNAEVLEFGCSLTTVIMDPRIPQALFNHSVWYALESVATYAPYTCLVVQTSACTIAAATATQYQQVEIVAQRIYNRSLPQFRRLMEDGKVRISILNHTKYKMKLCSNFFNPSSALMNINYWKDEFIENVDSDMILVTQDDTVLCHPFDVTLWDEFAFVGGIWPPKWSSRFGWCQQISAVWKQLTIKSRMRLQKLDNLCTNGYGPTGNGGFSLRNKNWMIRAIHDCPYLPFSGTSAKKNGDCSLPKFQNEDLYFATVLVGLRAPLPTAYEASLFSTEMLWPEQAEEFYGPLTQTQREIFIENRWGSNGLSMMERMHNPKTYGVNFDSSLLRTISIGLHKPWSYQPNSILTGLQVRTECKFLKFMFQPSMSTYDGALWRFPTPTIKNLHIQKPPEIVISQQDEKAVQALVVESISIPVNNATIPPILWFTYSTNILLDKKPSHFYQNVLKTVQKYAAKFRQVYEKKLIASGDVKVSFIDNQKCYTAVQLAYPPLAPHFLAEKEGAFKGDICRVAILYLYGGKLCYMKHWSPANLFGSGASDVGKLLICILTRSVGVPYCISYSRCLSLQGYYFDVDMGIITPYIVEDSSKISFVSVGDTYTSMFQSFIASTARNPVLQEAFHFMLDYYEGRHKACTRQNSCLMGTHTLMDAYRSASHVTNTFLLRQELLRPYLYPEIPRHSRPGCNFIVHDPIQRVVYFYSRIEGSNGCPFLGDDVSKTNQPCGGGLVGNGICPDAAFCCSHYGWCGKTKEFCAAHKKFSKANQPCGGGVAGNGICPDTTYCCSRYGWCGKTKEFCAHAAVKISKLK